MYKKLKASPLSHSNGSSFVYFRAFMGCHCSNVSSVSRCYGHGTNYSGLSVSDEITMLYRLAAVRF